MNRANWGLCSPMLESWVKRHGFRNWHALQDPFSILFIHVLPFLAWEAYIANVSHGADIDKMKRESVFNVVGWVVQRLLQWRFSFTRAASMVGRMDLMLRSGIGAICGCQVGWSQKWWKDHFMKEHYFGHGYCSGKCCKCPWYTLGHGDIEIGGDTRALSYLVPSSPFSCFPHRLFHQVSLLFSMELRKCRDAPRIYLCLQAVAEGSMVTFEIITSQVDGKPTACHVQVPSQWFRLVNCVLCCVRISTTYYTDAQQNPRGEFPFCTTHYHEDSLAHLEPFVNFCALFVLAATHGVDLTLSPCLSHSSLAFGHKIHIDRSVPWPPQQRNWRVHNSCFCRTCFDTTVTRNARTFLARANLLKSKAHILRPFESTGSDLVRLIITSCVPREVQECTVLSELHYWTPCMSNNCMCSEAR